MTSEGTNANAGPKPVGITCPTCLTKLRTVRVIPRVDGQVVRMKRCVRCSYKTRTSERAAAR